VSNRFAALTSELVHRLDHRVSDSPKRRPFIGRRGGLRIRPEARRAAKGPLDLDMRSPERNIRHPDIEPLRSSGETDADGVPPLWENPPGRR
jgi:hypothetical protein